MKEDVVLGRKEITRTPGLHIVNGVNDKTFNKRIQDKDLGVSAARLAHKEGIPFIEARELLSIYYYESPNS